jgi:phosphoglycerate kinase
MGINIGNSRVENDKLDVAKEILSKYKDKLVLPTDHMIINEFKDPSVI